MNATANQELNNHSALDFALTDALKRAGIRAGYKARETVAPGKLTFKDCTIDEKKKILELLNAKDESTT